MPLVSVKSTFSLLFWHKILIPSFKCYCHEGLCMSQHTGSHKNGLNLLGEKYLNESHWRMHRIRLLECTKNVCLSVFVLNAWAVKRKAKWIGDVFNLLQILNFLHQIMLSYAFLAHLSRRLTRWAYRIGLELASVRPCVRVCDRVSVNNFKHEYL